MRFAVLLWPMPTPKTTPTNEETNMTATLTPEQISQTELGRQLLAEAREDERRERQALFDKKAAAEIELQEGNREYGEKIAKLKAARDKSEQKYRQSIAALYPVSREARDFAVRRQRIVSEADRELTATADPQIRDFQHEISEAKESLRGKLRYSAKTEYDADTDRHVDIRQSNAADIDAVCHKLKDLRERAEALKLQAEPDQTEAVALLRDELDKLMRDI